MPQRARVLIAVCLALVIGLGLSERPAAQEREAASIALSGTGVASTALDRTGLASLPAVERDVVFATSKGERRGRYRGPLLWTVLERTGLLRGIEHNAELKRTLVVTGRDGYAIAFSIGEIAPDFGNAPIMVALHVDGLPLPPDEGLRLIVPGDKRGARNVFDIVKIEVR